MVDHADSNFCLLFYRAFYTITFKKQESEAEVQRYLADAKSATEGSENKKKLLETTEEKVPMAAKLIRMGLPIIHKEIDKDITILCDAARGTKVEDYVNQTCKEVREIIKIRNPIELDTRINGLIPNLTFMVENLPERARDFGYDKIGNLNLTFGVI